MELRRDLLLGVGALLALNILIAFAAIGLFSRMGPVIEQVLLENVYSNEAAEEMLSLVAVSGGEAFTESQRAQFEAALERATANITEPEESGIIAQLRALRDPVFANFPGARTEAVARIRELILVNRNAMRETNREARRLGVAGAWFSVFMAAFGLVLSIIVVKRMSRRLLDPVRELFTTLEAARGGDPYRRCAAASPPLEFKRIFSHVNELLDLRFRPRPFTERRGEIDRAALLWALDRESHPVFVVDERGQMFAANTAAHELLGEKGGPAVRVALSKVKGTRAHDVSVDLETKIHAEPLRDVGAWLCTVTKTAVPS